MKHNIQRIVKKRMSLMMLPIIATSFIACGDGDANFSNPETTITITDCETYTDIVNGDVLIKDSDNTQIKTVINTNNTKKVCLVSGSAHILRKG